MADPDLSERPVEHPVVREDQGPRVHADEIVGPQRQEHGHEEHCACSRPGHPRHVVRERERNHRVRERDHRCHPGGPQDDAAVRAVLDQQLEVAEVPDAFDVRGEWVDRPERRDQQDHERGQVDDDEPRERRGEEAGGPRPRTAPQRRRDAGRPPLRARLDRGRHQTTSR